MIVKIYNNKSNKNVVNKKIKEVQEISFNFKDDSDITNPILILKSYESGNYCYIPELKRYYYIDKIDLMNGGAYKLYLEIDVLMSYKDEILNAEYFSEDGGIFEVKNNIDWNTIYNPNKFILIIGG